MRVQKNGSVVQDRALPQCNFAFQGLNERAGDNAGDVVPHGGGGGGMARPASSTAGASQLTPANVGQTLWSTRVSI